MTMKEACPLWLLVVLVFLVPVAIILIVSLIFVPGATVPRGTPASLVWKRKLWELHAGWLGLCMSLVVATFLIQGLKNMFGKPRPDLLARCRPDIANAAKFAIGGLDLGDASNRLYSDKVCLERDPKIIDDGFRSYPSGHSAGAAAGLIYLALFLASKFSVTLPFVVPPQQMLHQPGETMYEAFPSRGSRSGTGSSSRGGTNGLVGDRDDVIDEQHNARLRTLRRQAAAPPLYLFALVFIPICASFWIAASRWYDFRHHGFDIICGYLIGLVPAYFSFRYYHLPIHQGAGWAWGPRSDSRAFWAGVGHLGYVGDQSEIPTSKDGIPKPGHGPSHSEDIEAQGGAGASYLPTANTGRTNQQHQHQPGSPDIPSYEYSTGYNGAGGYNANARGGYQDIELDRMNNRV